MKKTKIKMPPEHDLPSFTIESVHGSEEETARAKIELYGSTNIKPPRSNNEKKQKK